MNRIDTPRECSQRPAIGLGLILAAMLVCSQANALDHAGLDLLLRQVVHNQGVDYPALLSRQSQLDEYLAALAAVDPVTFSSWQDSEQMAYWINAYNAFALKAIAEHYPLSRRGIKGLAFPANSIWQIPGVWKKLRRPAVGGVPKSLDDIEHGTLRKAFNEPRVHFALVCASVGCPPLRPEAYTAQKLESQLEDQTRRFLNDNRHGMTIRDKGIYVSRIFKWFGEDFEQFATDECRIRGRMREAGIAAFVARYRPDTEYGRLCGGTGRLKFLKYDWRLNEA